MTSADAILAEEAGEGLFQVRVRAGPHSIMMDEPLAAGGLDSGPNPFDLLGAAIASCTLMTMKMYANRKGWALQGLGVRATFRQGSAGARDRFECLLELGNANAEQREALVRIAQRCPVHLLLERGADAPTTIAPDAFDEAA